jgi:hypothetical protein
MANFSVSFKPKSVYFTNHINGSISVNVHDSEPNFAHLHFETPIEAWQWASKLALEIEKQMNAEVTE